MVSGLAGTSPRTRALPIMAGASKYEHLFHLSLAKICAIYKASILYYQYEIDYVCRCAFKTPKEYYNNPNKGQDIPLRAPLDDLMDVLPLVDIL